MSAHYPGSPCPSRKGVTSTSKRNALEQLERGETFISTVRWILHDNALPLFFVLLTFS